MDDLGKKEVFRTNSFVILFFCRLSCVLFFFSFSSQIKKYFISFPILMI